MKLLDLLLRWVIGFIFIYASLHKLVDPCSFSVAVENYHLLPFRFLINIMAVLLPVFELICGLALILNTRVKGASLNISILTTIFIIAISINLILGREFDCGCFSPYDPDHVSSPFILLIRDIFTLAGAIAIYFRRIREDKN